MLLSCRACPRTVRLCRRHEYCRSFSCVTHSGRSPERVNVHAQSMEDMPGKAFVDFANSARLFLPA